MHMRYLFGLLLLLANAAAAQQPYSRSMAECAGLMAFSRDHVNRPDRVAMIETMARNWRAAAEAQAMAEGRENPAFYVSKRAAAAHAEWTDRGIFAVFSQDFRDWTAYCGSFAAAQGIDLLAD